MHAVLDLDIDVGGRGGTPGGRCRYGNGQDRTGGVILRKRAGVAGRGGERYRERSGAIRR